MAVRAGAVFCTNPTCYQLTLNGLSVECYCNFTNIFGNLQVNVNRTYNLSQLMKFKIHSSPDACFKGNNEIGVSFIRIAPTHKWNDIFQMYSKNPYVMVMEKGGRTKIDTNIFK